MQEKLVVVSSCQEEQKLSNAKTEWGVGFTSETGSTVLHQVQNQLKGVEKKLKVYKCLAIFQLWLCDFTIYR